MAGVIIAMHRRGPAARFVFCVFGCALMAAGIYSLYVGAATGRIAWLYRWHGSKAASWRDDPGDFTLIATVYGAIAIIGALMVRRSWR